MQLQPTVFDIDCKAVSEKIEDFICEYVAQSKTKGVVVGLSGGIDSSVTTALAVRALGKRNVLGLILPNANLAQHYEDDARTLARQLGITVKKVSIADFISAFTKNVDKELSKNRLVLGNAMARFRMIINYAYANYYHYLVLGTSNKTEIMVGYVTKYGDGGVDFEPCGGLYKTQIRLMAKYLNIPKPIIEKPPSAGFWDGQTDEGELGITYDLLDLILYGIEHNYNPKDIAKELQIKEMVVERVLEMTTKSEHKRHIPPVFELE